MLCRHHNWGQHPCSCDVAIAAGAKHLAEEEAINIKRARTLLDPVNVECWANNQLNKLRTLIAPNGVVKLVLKAGALLRYGARFWRSKKYAHIAYT